MVVNAAHEMIFIEMPSFSKEVSVKLTTHQLDDLYSVFQFDIEIGLPVQGCDGLRYLLWPAKLGDENYGSVIIYLYIDQHSPVYMIAVYSAEEDYWVELSNKDHLGSLIEGIKHVNAAHCIKIFNGSAA